MNYHTPQARRWESSHFHDVGAHTMLPAMENDEVFRANLIALMKERGLKAATLSKKANLNARAVKDIEEGRSGSPRLVTLQALADALEVDLGELLGLGPRVKLRRDLAEFLAQYDEDDQGRFLAALSAIPPPRP
ncbi:helix-turn-helix transcriptional regulator [Cereibacter sphaeroides f. sp. denitrificans]